MSAKVSPAKRGFSLLRVEGDRFFSAIMAMVSWPTLPQGKTGREMKSRIKKEKVGFKVKDFMGSPYN
jgi:hypothetical protein